MYVTTFSNTDKNKLPSIGINPPMNTQDSGPVICKPSNSVQIKMALLVLGPQSRGR